LLFGGQQTHNAKPIIGLSLIVTFFFFDLLQYVSGAIVTGIWTRHAEKRKYNDTGSIEGEYQRPAWLDWPTLGLFWIKIAILAAGFGAFVGEVVPIVTAK